MNVGLEVRVRAWGKGQLQGWRVRVFQDVTDLKGRQDGETVHKVARSIAEASKLEASLTEEKYF